jgi:hypothetical protein
MTPTGFAITYTRAGDPQPHWLIRPGRGCTVVDELVVCRTRTEANEVRRQLLEQPGITDARVWTLEETRAAAEQAVEGLIDGLRANAAETLAPAS